MVLHVVEYYTIFKNFQEWKVQSKSKLSGKPLYCTDNYVTLLSYYTVAFVEELLKSTLIWDLVPGFYCSLTFFRGGHYNLTSLPHRCSVTSMLRPTKVRQHFILLSTKVTLVSSRDWWGSG